MTIENSSLIQLTGVSGAQDPPPSPVLNRGGGTSLASNSNRTDLHLRPGDLVVVRSPDEILQSLGSDGTLDGLPVMPEMLPYCGKRFRILQYVVQACVDGAFLKAHTESYVREFRNHGVFTLEGVRCSGANHNGCQRGCAIFWKEAWLQKVEDHQEPAGHQVPVFAGAELLISKMKTKTEQGVYFCQSSEFLKATLHLTFARRVRNCLQSVAVGNLSAFAMVKRIFRWMWWKTRHKLLGEHAKGTQANTPTESLNLQPGELVEVRSFQDIVATLNPEGRNRGLHFSGDQRPFCGGRYRVRSRADRYIAEATGEMKQFRNTVILEDVLCDSSYYAFGGCCRSDLLYWREIWLRRVEERSDAATAAITASDVR